MFSCHSLPIVGRIFFRCFGMSCFVCIALPFVVISLIFLLWPVFSGLFPQVVPLFSPMLPVPSSRLFQRLSFLLFGLVFVFLKIFICVSSRISRPGFDCLFVFFFRGSQFSHKLILLLHRLVHLTRLYYSSLCKVVCDLIFRFYLKFFPFYIS